MRKKKKKNTQVYPILLEKDTQEEKTRNPLDYSYLQHGKDERIRTGKKTWEKEHFFE